MELSKKHNACLISFVQKYITVQVITITKSNYRLTNVPIQKWIKRLQYIGFSLARLSGTNFQFQAIDFTPLHDVFVALLVMTLPLQTLWSHRLWFLLCYTEPHGDICLRFV